MNGANIIIYLLLAFFIAGTSYLTYITTKDIMVEFRHHMKALARVPRIRNAIRYLKNIANFNSTTVGTALQK